VPFIYYCHCISMHMFCWPTQSVHFWNCTYA